MGDSGYPLEPWLLTPFGQVEPNSAPARYNKALSKIRTIMEHVNGMLKARFRCTHGHRALHYDPIRAAKIIYTCAVLHNMYRKLLTLLYQKKRLNVPTITTYQVMN